MAKRKGAIIVDIDKCKGCELCVVACPTVTIACSIQVNNKGYHYAYMDNPDACVACGFCAVVCPDSVITIYRL